MSDEGFEERQKAGEQRIAERNAAELGQTLEGPGCEARIQNLYRRFKSQGLGSPRREPGPAVLVLIGLVVFLSILFFGLGKPIIERMATEVNAQSR